MNLSKAFTPYDMREIGIPTFNTCEHYVLKPDKDIMQTIVIDVGHGKYLTVNLSPESDNVDVKMHGDHRFTDFGTVKAFYNMGGAYNERN